LAGYGRRDTSQRTREMEALFVFVLIGMLLFLQICGARRVRAPQRAGYKVWIGLAVAIILAIVLLTFCLRPLPRLPPLKFTPVAPPPAATPPPRPPPPPRMAAP
jgi:NhaP-type Na+/H+ or K+/H+ antiporter